MSDQMLLDHLCSTAVSKLLNESNESKNPNLNLDSNPILASLLTAIAKAASTSSGKIDKATQTRCNRDESFNFNFNFSLGPSRDVNLSISILGCPGRMHQLVRPATPGRGWCPSNEFETQFCKMQFSFQLISWKWKKKPEKKETQKGASEAEQAKELQETPVQLQIWQIQKVCN